MFLSFHFTKFDKHTVYIFDIFNYNFKSNFTCSPNSKKSLHLYDHREIILTLILLICCPYISFLFDFLLQHKNQLFMHYWDPSAQLKEELFYLARELLFTSLKSCYVWGCAWGLSAHVLSCLISFSLSVSNIFFVCE